MNSSSAPHPAVTSACEVVLFHSVLGLRPGVLAWADRLRGAGHRVHTPDLYGGEVFDEMESGFRKVEEIGGIEALIERTQAAVAELPGDVVYAGFSNGGGSAQLLALTRPGARGAILMHAALPLEAFGMEEWPSGVAVQVHYAENDPYREQSAIDALAGAVRRSGAAFEAWDYPGEGHLFADPDLEDHDAGAAERMLERVLAFLAREGGAPRKPVLPQPNVLSDARGSGAR
jgi:dienelactone hydrolase